MKIDSPPVPEPTAASAPSQPQDTSEKSADVKHTSPQPVQDFDIAADLALLGQVLSKVPGSKKLLMIFSGSVVVTICNMIGQVRLNKWNGQFFDSISRKDLPDFLHFIGTFFPLVAILLTLAVAGTFLQERLKFRLREWLSKHLLTEWLQPMRIYKLGFAGEDARNPDQRIQEDTRLLGEHTVDLACGAVSSLLQMAAFIGVLWGLSTQVTFSIGGQLIAIPGYMVWCALLYAGIGSGLTYLVGRPLIRLNAERYVREAEFRFALVRVDESGESIALHAGENDERTYLERSLGSVIDVMRRISTSLAQLTWITSGTGWISIVVPMLVAAPAYFHGGLTLGGLIMVTGAFTQVQGALRWFVDNFSRLAEWRAAVHRVARFRAVLDEVPDVDEASGQIQRSVHTDGHLALEGLRIHRPDGQSVIEDASVVFTPGDRVLITGETGAGKSTLFRAIAGIWPWGSGTILTPPPEAMSFLPQRPYLPLGTLRYALSYPSGQEAFSDEELQRVLERCDLGDLMPKLDKIERWDKALSNGEQQRLAFARLLLHKPSWVFLDEATAAMDQQSQHRVMSLFADELKDTTLLSIGHRLDLADYHTKTLQLVHDSEGDRLKMKSSLAAATPPRWLRRLIKLLPAGPTVPIPKSN